MCTEFHVVSMETNFLWNFLLLNSYNLATNDGFIPLLHSITSAVVSASYVSENRLIFVLGTVLLLRMSSVSQYIAYILKQIKTASFQILPHLPSAILSHQIWCCRKYCCWKCASKYPESGQARCTVFVSAVYGFSSWNSCEIQFLCREITQYDSWICYFVFSLADFASNSKHTESHRNGMEFGSTF